MHHCQKDDTVNHPFSHLQNNLHQFTSMTVLWTRAKDLNPDTISYYGNYYGGLGYGYGCKYGYTSGFGAFRILDCGYRCGCGGL
ncbi:keratin-associated protein 20-3 [Chlorocebus sabaeus]|uniref:keratin-associated protein 20-3 n=1 Tax=Chlorocebus sabaeus TaxID=60711 RepID=UPI003BF98215